MRRRWHRRFPRLDGLRCCLEGIPRCSRPGSILARRAATSAVRCCQGQQAWVSYAIRPRPRRARRLLPHRCISRFQSGACSWLQCSRWARPKRLPTPRAGQTAPNRYAQLKRRSRSARGRLPRLAQIRVSVPCWPTLASSWNQISIGLPAARSPSASLAKSAKFF